ncbi:MAG TPA: hypothetical protein VKK79_04415 [Candidatus Lokiarchaeia archaeon]|nr:hypothetical protein [Candidatus Lokiarchaeia archaeon]
MASGWFDNAGDAIAFAKETYAPGFFDLPQEQQGPQLPVHPKGIHRQACLGDFWPARQSSNIAES